MSLSRHIVSVLLVLVSVSAAADGTLYGLRNPGDAGRQLVTVDPSNGAVTPIGGSIDPPNGTPSGVVALDLGGGRFFFVGTPGVETTMRLYTLDVATGAVLSSPTIEAGTAILGLEYDEDEDVLYGLRNPGDGGKQLVALNVTTGVGTPISVSIAPPLGVPGGTNALDAGGNRFFFIGTPAAETGHRIYTVDTSTGVVLASPVVSPTSGVLHLEYDDVEGVLYGVHNPGDAGKQLVSIDPATGAITPISASIDAPLGVASGVNALDADIDQFYFMGHRSSEVDWRLYAINTSTGAAASHLIPGSGSQFFVGLALTDPPAPPPVLEVTIDVRSTINVKSKGVIPVAILTTPSFDATTVDVGTVRFGPGNASEAHGIGHPSDVDGDGDIDLVLHFRTQDAAIPCGAMSATLTGETTGGQQITGTDSITTTGC